MAAWEALTFASTFEVVDDMAMFRSAFIGPDYRKLAKVRGFDDRTQSPVPVDPIRHQALIAKAFIRDSTALDASETLGKGDLLG